MQNFWLVTTGCLCLVLATPSTTKAATTVFVNPCPSGCEFSPGADNSVANTSSLINSTRNLSAFSAGTPTFNAVLECLSGILAPFDIVITTADPAPAQHTELVLAGTPGQFLFSDSVPAVAPFNCNLISNAPAFVFANNLGADSTLMCHLAAAQIGALAGLEPLYNCQDVMSYLPSCGPRSFTNVSSQCGTFGAATCICGGSTRNSFSTMRSAYGPADPVFDDGFETLP
jgi:hypothetical protein